MTSTFDKFIHDRHDLRKKYFETDGYYKWSDIIDDDNYKRRRDACFIRSIIAGTHKNWNSDFTRIMDNHIEDPKVNWNAIFTYLYEVFEIIPDDEYSIKNENRGIIELLEPYQDELLTVYTGF